VVARSRRAVYSCNGDAYLDRLGELLWAEGLRVEVINTAVWGYNARQQVATLRYKALSFDPDVVVVGLCGNDRDYPSYVDERPFVELHQSFVWNEVAGRIARLQNAPAHLPRADELMPFSAFLAAYSELAKLARASAFDVIVFSDCFGASSAKPQRPTCHLGTPSEWAEFNRRLDDWGVQRCRWDPDGIPMNYPDWGHATAEGNRKLAMRLATCVRPLLEKQ
jgi:hypothetical protein